MSDVPVTPRPAATVLLLRRGAKHGSRGVEVLMVRRSGSASFMPGVWVFPGGIVEPGESPAAAAARELDEEAGIELGDRGRAGRVVALDHPGGGLGSVRHPLLRRARRPHAKAEADGVEVSAADWFEPRAALDAHEAGEIELVFPTIKTLETLLGHETAEEVIEAARRRQVEPILPRVVGTRSEHRVLLPWEDGYEEAESSVERLPP